MSNPDFSLPVNSPSLPVESGVVDTRKEFVHGLTMDLTDSESQQALAIVIPIKRKWERVFRSKLRDTQFTVEQAMKLVDDFEDELVTTLAERMDLIATVDVSPCFEGQPPIIDFVGCLSSHGSAEYGFDHEKEQWEIRKAHGRGEDFLGEREGIDNQTKQRDRAERSKRRDSAS